MPKTVKPRKKYVPKPVHSPFERINRQAQVSLSLFHYLMVDAIATGEANAQTMYDFCDAVHTWSHLIDPSNHDDKEMFIKVGDACESMAIRYRKLGRVVLTGLELQAAKDVASWIDSKVASTPPNKVMGAITKTQNEINRIGAV